MSRFICKLCKKELSFQKTVALRKCGEVFCRKCLDVACKNDKNCPICSKPFSDLDILELKESGSGYSYHNNVEIMKLNPFFKC